MIIDVKIYDSNEGNIATQILQDMGYDTDRLRGSITNSYPTYIVISDSSLTVRPAINAFKCDNIITLNGLKDLQHGYDKNFAQFVFPEGVFEFYKLRQLQKNSKLGLPGVAHTPKSFQKAVDTMIKQGKISIADNLVKGFTSGGTILTNPPKIPDNETEYARIKSIEDPKAAYCDGKGNWFESGEIGTFVNGIFVPNKKKGIKPDFGPIFGDSVNNEYCNCEKRTPKRTSTSIGVKLTEKNTYYICTNCKKEIK